MKKLLFYLILIIGLNGYSQINVSTGIDNTGGTLPVGTVDPNWVITSPASTALTCGYHYLWQSTPIPVTNAGWINKTGVFDSSTTGDHIFERQFTVTPTDNTITCNFSIAWDDTFISLELVRPDLTTIPLTVTATTYYHLSSPITNVIPSAMPGTWKIRAKVNFFDTVAGFLLSGNVALSYVTPPDCGNTFVKEVNPIGTNSPKLCKKSTGEFYTTSTSSIGEIILNKFDTNGNELWSRNFNLGLSDPTLKIVEMIIDSSDSQLVGVLNSASGTKVFKYDDVTNTATWINNIGSTRAFNIHETSSTKYVVTGQSSANLVEMFDIDQATGTNTGFHTTGIGGEFYSTYDSGTVYGSCRYYADAGSQFFPSLFSFNASNGANNWIKTYIKNTPTARIYPVAPIVDGASLVQLNTGNDDNFGAIPSTTKIWLLKTDLSGVINWTKQITIFGFDRLNGVKIINTSTGYYLLVNGYDSAGLKNFFFVVKTDKSGVLQWVNKYGVTGENYVTDGFEKAGYLFLTGMSSSYSSPSKMMLLKLDTTGKTDTACGFIQQLQGNSTVYANLETSRPAVSNSALNFIASPLSASSATLTYAESIKCSTPCSLGYTQVQSSQCGSILPRINEKIIADYLSGATDYQFRVTDITHSKPSITTPVPPGIRTFYLTNLAGYYDFGTTYQIEVRVMIGGVWQPYGPSCTVTTPLVYTQVRSLQCGSTLTTMNQNIYADFVPWASTAAGFGTYKFEVTNLTTSAIQTITSDLDVFNLSNPLFTLGFVTYNTTYSIRVAVRKYDGTYMPFGSVCSVTTPSCPTTQIRTSQCGTVIPTTSTQIWADLVSSATNYRFRLSNVAAGYSQVWTNPISSAMGRFCRLNNFVPAPLLAGGTMYNLEVCLSFDNGATFCNYGPICTVSTPVAFRPDTITRETSSNGEFKVVAYPNPSNSVFNLNVSSASEDTVEVRVYDMIGKLIDVISTDFSKVNEIVIGNSYPSGVYNVVVNQGNDNQSIRLIKR